MKNIIFPAIIFFSIIFFPSFVFAKINPSNHNIELSVDTELNKAAIGQMSLVVKPDDSLLLKWSEIEPKLEKLLYPKTLDLLEKKVKNDLISEKDLKNSGFAVDFDLSDFNLKISAPISLMRPQVLSLKDSQDGLKALNPTEFSGFLNLYSSYFYQKDNLDDTDDKDLALRSEMVMNMNGWVLENENEYSSNTTDDGSSVKRLGTRLIHDLPLKGARISIGDNYAYGSYFQSSNRILGVSIAHDFSLVSDRTIRPSASRSFTLSTPSTVEVMVDNQVVKRLNLSSGVYSLNDIPLNEGTNNITLRITDNVGVVKYVKFGVTTGLDLFSKGELKYELHVGVPAELNTKLVYDYNDPLISGYLNYGLAPDWTIGVNSQADQYLQQFGFKNIYASSIGQLSFENAISFSDKTGQAYRVVYSSFTDNSPKHKSFSLGYEYSTQFFRSLGYRPGSDDSFQRTEHMLQANYSFSSTPNFQTTLSASASKIYDQNGFNNSIGVNFSHDTDNGQVLYNFGGQVNQDDGNPDWSVNLAVTYKFNDTERLKLSHQTEHDRTRLEYTDNGDLRYVGAYSVRAGVEQNDQDKAQLNLNAQYNANRFLASVDQESYYEQLNSQSATHATRVSLSTSLAFAGGDWGIGKPIYDSFALVKGHPSLEGKKITLGQFNDQYRASNDALDTIVLSDIPSYNKSNVAVDVADLAPGYDIGSGLLSFYPSYHSGYAITVGSDANTSILATLLDKKNKPISMQVGTAVCSTDSVKKENVFFTNKSGRFALTGLKPCLYDFTLKNPEKSKFQIDVEKGQQLQRKGKIYVH